MKAVGCLVPQTGEFRFYLQHAREFCFPVMTCAVIVNFLLHQRSNSPLPWKGGLSTAGVFCSPPEILSFSKAGAGQGFVHHLMQNIWSRTCRKVTAAGPALEGGQGKRRIPAYHLPLSFPAPVFLFLCLLSACSDPSLALGHLLLTGSKPSSHLWPWQGGHCCPVTCPVTCCQPSSCLLQWGWERSLLSLLLPEPR